MIKELKKAKIKFVVAPYEADAQLAFLSKHNAVHAVSARTNPCLLFERSLSTF